MSRNPKPDTGAAQILLIFAFIFWGIMAFLLFILFYNMSLGQVYGISTFVTPAIFGAIGGLFWYFRGRAKAGTAPDMMDVGGAIFAFVGFCMMFGGGYLALENLNGLILVGMGAVFFGCGFLIKKLSSGSNRMQHMTMESADFSRTSSSVAVDRANVADEIADIKRRSLDDKYMRRDDWVNGRIATDIGRAGNFIYWMAGVVWAIALVLVICIFVADFSWFPAFFFIFVGVSIGVPAGKSYLHRRKFAASWLVIDPMPGTLGGPMKVAIETGIGTGQTGAAACTLTLICLRFYEESSGDDSTKTVTKTVWSREVHETASPRAGSDVLHIAAEFNVPAELPATTLISSSEGIKWRLQVQSTLRGLDYNVKFELPVFSAGFTHEAVRSNADDTPATDSAATADGSAQRDDPDRPWGT